ncbi:hypothetical protein Trco_006142 [Trichoderma cornu-damae]|uniref:Uncharacterized protein n=1 Tax=Trichoderma cornu-damae TaxID=654480 RepID=A0A9P8QKT5_9HYPO|nr:hypothetical protein Trco_006142 [Trichoderma cornu-damae]
MYTKIGCSYLTRASTMNEPYLRTSFQDHERKLFTVVEVIDGLSSLESRVGIPDTAGLVADLLDRVGVGGIGRRNVLHSAGLDSNDTHGNTTKASTTNDNSSSPAAKGLNERVLVEQPALERTIVVLLTGNHPPDIIGLLLGRVVSDVAVPAVEAWADRDGATTLLGHKRHPLDNLGNTLKVIVGGHVRNTVAVHDLGTTKLEVGGVDFTTEKVVQSRSTSKDDGLTFNLDSTLAKTDKIGTNTCKKKKKKTIYGNSEDVVVSLAGGSGNKTRSPQTLNAETILLSHNRNNLVSLLATLNHFFGDDLILEAILGLLVQVQVTEAALVFGSIVPGNLEMRHQLVCETKTGTRVSRQVDARNAQFTSQLGALVEEVVFLGAEGSNLVRDVVGNNNETATGRVLWGLSLDNPSNHSACVGAGLTVDLVEVVLVVKHKLGECNTIADLGLLRRQSGLPPDGLCPAVLDGLAEQLGEIVHVLGTHQVSLVSLRLEPVLGSVWRGNGQQVQRTLFLGSANAVEDPVTFIGLALSVQVDVHDIARGVGDCNTQGVWNTGLGVRANNTNLHLGNTQSPGTGAKSIQEALEGLFNSGRVELEDGSEVHEDVVEIRVVIADNLEGVEDVVDDTVGLRDEVFGSGDLVAETTGSDHGTSEVTLVRVDSLANSLIHVNVLVLREHGLDAEVGKTGQLQLEGQGRLTVTDAVVFLVVRASESVVARVRAVAATAYECQTTDPADQQLALETLNNGQDAREGLFVILAL